MSDNCNIPHPLKREGTNQQERFPAPLRKGYVNVDDKSLPDLLKQSAEFARLINYYNETNPQAPDGSWQQFFEEVYDFLADKLRVTNSEAMQQGNASPHLALLLTFLELYKEPQKEINHFINRHLNFYYRDILKIKEQKEIADKVVVFFELVKSFKQQIVPKNTLLKAGKDAIGKELFYKTLDELVVNRGTVEEIKTVYTKKNDAGNVVGLFASPVANSADGKGAEIVTTPPSWVTFGNEQPNQQPPNATIGFAITSPILNLREGVRIIKIVNNGLSDISIGALKVSYTIEKGWLECLPNQVTFSISSSNSLDITLQVADPPVTSYAEKVHLKGFNTVEPVVLIELKQDSSLAFQFENFKSLGITGTKLHVHVEKLKNLALYNDFGVLDNSKPFLPFGILPKQGTNFYIGAADIFNKYLKSFSANSPILPVVVSYLRSAQWDSSNIFQNAYSHDRSLTSSTTDGFIRLTLNDNSFSIDEYETKLLKYVNKDSTQPDPPVRISPQLQDFTLTYDAEAELNANNHEHRFFKIYPFGFLEADARNGNFIDDWSVYNGRLFIGIRNLPQYASISLYFQMHEGTGNTIVEPVNVEWNWVSGNNYISMGRNILKDTTNNFTQSGIMRFAMPNQPILPNTILNSELTWLRASVRNNVAAFPKMISIVSQAAEAVFDNRDNDSNHLAAPLPPETISKTVEKIDGIKSLTQPYTSYGGRIKENAEDDSFRTRISERLRHKQRSWSIWDYERMLLQRFPFVHKIKCISHTTANTEFAPGNVLIVALPFVNAVNTQDKYQPRLSTGRLEEMKNFLQKYHSPFAKIDVINPDYEKLKVTATVAFYPGDNEFNKTRLEQELNDFFAPWAQSADRQIFFRSKMYAAQVMNFIEEREYVDFITAFELVKYDTDTSNFHVCPEVAIGSNEHVVLTTYSSHNILFTDRCNANE